MRTDPRTDPAFYDEQLALALRLVNFFTANPSYEVASMKVTAAQGTALRNAALSTQQALGTATVTLNNIGITWTDAYNTLTGEMRALIKILGATLDNDDPCWLAFGLNMPSTSTTPGKPANVTVTMDETGALMVQCDAVPLATRYRFRMLLVGIQTEYQLVARSPEPVGVISDVMPGQTVQMIVQAVNGNLQGVASDPVQFTVPLQAARTAEAQPTPVLAPIVEEAVPVKRQPQQAGGGRRSRLSAKM